MESFLVILCTGVDYTNILNEKMFNLQALVSVAEMAASQESTSWMIFRFGSVTQLQCNQVICECSNLHASMTSQYTLQ